MSHDTQSTRLHAKAWLFHRATGFSTSHIGSSNLSKAALVDGIEWNVRLSQVETPSILDKFGATFETYWQSAEYESYDTARDAARFDRTVAPERADSLESPLLFLDVEPWPHQREMLEKLAVERGGTILLFVRHRKKQDGRTLPYAFLGPADYVSHQGDRPISFVWKLRTAMPADFFRQARVATA